MAFICTWSNRKKILIYQFVKKIIHFKSNHHYGGGSHTVAAAQNRQSYLGTKDMALMENLFKRLQSAKKKMYIYFNW